VAATLLERGARIRMIVRSRGRGERFAKGGADVAIGTLQDVKFLEEALRGAEGAFLLLPHAGAPTVAEIRANARTMGKGCAEAIGASRVPHVVFVSAQGAQLAEGVGVIGHLHDVEVELARSGAVLTILRCARMMHEFEKALPSMKERGVLPNFNLEDRPGEFI